MIETMTYSNDNESNQLTFPIQVTDNDLKDLSDGEAMVQSRLMLTQYLNKVSRGEAIVTEKLKAHIINVNRIYKEQGYQTIDVDFD